jgi:hypothetical protein
MRRLLWTLTFAFVCYPTLADSAAAAPPPETASPTAEARPEEGRDGIRWERSLAAAKAKAARTGKPLLILHLFGRLDEAFC